MTYLIIVKVQFLSYDSILFTQIMNVDVICRFFLQDRHTFSLKTNIHVFWVLCGIQVPLSNYYAHLLCKLSFYNMIVLNEHPVPFHCLNYIHYENYCENEGLLKILIIYCGNSKIQLIYINRCIWYIYNYHSKNLHVILI